MRQRITGAARRFARFAREEDASELPMNAIKIGLWVVAGLAVVGVAYAKVIAPALNQSNNCATAATGNTSSALITGGGTGALTTTGC